MGPCRCKLLFVIKHRWTLQFSPLVNVRAKNLRLPDVEAGLNLHCLIFLNLITGDIINFFFLGCDEYSHSCDLLCLCLIMEGGWERCMKEARYFADAFSNKGTARNILKAGWNPGSF